MSRGGAPGIQVPANDMRCEHLLAQQDMHGQHMVAAQRLHISTMRAASSQAHHGVELAQRGAVADGQHGDARLDALAALGGRRQGW